MTTSAELTNEAVEDAVDHLEDVEGYDDLDPLEVYFEVSMDGTVKRVYAVTATGGPHIEVDLWYGTVTAYWGGDKAVRHVSPKAEDVLGEIGDFYAQQFEDSTLA